MPKTSKNILFPILFTMVTLCATATWGWAWFGSLKTALLYTGGMRIVAEPDTQSVGELDPKARATVKFLLSNLSGKPITVHGSTASCTCLIVDNLPKSVPAGGREEIEIAFRAGESPGEVRQSVVLLTDAATTPRVPLTITGRIIGKSRHEESRAQ